MSEPVLATRGLKRSFTQGDVTIEVLRGVDLEVQRGEIVALLGPSGSGKSTLLQAVGLLEGGFEGSIRLQGEEAAELDDDGRTRLRRDLLGFVPKDPRAVEAGSATPWEPGGISAYQYRAGHDAAERFDRPYDSYGATPPGEATP